MRPASLDAEEVERRCAAQGPARAAGPLRRALAALAGRFQALRGWERSSYARAGDCARERLGLSARELADLARVDTALRTLPRLEAALVSGELPWTKVRLVARAAKPEEEVRWIAFARRVSVRQLERHVRAIDAESIEGGGAEADPEDEGRRQGVVLKLRHGTSVKWQLGWRLARRVAGEALDPGGGAEWITAEVLSALPGVAADEEVAPPGLTFQERRVARWRQRLEPARSLRALFEEIGREGGGGRFEGEKQDRGAEPVALPSYLRELVEDLESADAFELDARLRRAVALEQRLEAELGPLLSRVAAQRLYRVRGFPSLERYAAERLGISPRKCWSLLRIERLGRHAPALLRAYREGEISWVQAQALVRIAERAPEHAGRWLAFARRVSVRRLRDDVDRALLLADRDAGLFARTGGVPDLEAELAAASDAEAERIRLQTGANTRGMEATPTGTGSDDADPARLQTGANTRDLEGTPQEAGAETSRVFFTAPRDVARLFRATVATVQRRLGAALGRPATLSDGLDAMLEHCFEAWGIRDPEQERRRKRDYRIFERDGWRCAVPGCTSYRNLHAHHKEYRSHGGDDADENLIAICAWHHQRALHTERVLRITGRARTRFELGVRPGRAPLAVYACGDVLLGRTGPNA